MFEYQLHSWTVRLMLHSPCREDRANAAISWMVRARLDFGNISMVSSTFTWKDKRRKKKKRVTQRNTGTVAQLSMNVSHLLNIFCNDSQKYPVLSFHGEETPVFAVQLLQCTSRLWSVKGFLFTHRSMILKSHKLYENNLTCTYLHAHKVILTCAEQWLFQQLLLNRTMFIFKSCKQSMLCSTL